jgi:hypothetical protein
LFEAINIQKQGHAADITHCVFYNEFGAILLLPFFGETDQAAGIKTLQHDVITDIMWAGFTEAQPSRAVLPLWIKLLSSHKANSSHDSNTFNRTCKKSVNHL